MGSGESDAGLCCLSFLPVLNWVLQETHHLLPSSKGSYKEKLQMCKAQGSAALLVSLGYRDSRRLQYYPSLCHEGHWALDPIVPTHHPPPAGRTVTPRLGDHICCARTGGGAGIPVDMLALQRTDDSHTLFLHPLRKSRLKEIRGTRSWHS